MLDRHPSRHGDRRDGRDSRLTDVRGLDRLGDRPRDFSGSDRRAMDANPRDFRLSDRPSGSDRDRDRDRVRPDPPPRWTADSARENLERSSNNARGAENGRLSRDMPPPRASSDRGPPINPDRQPLFNTERPELMNPERAALISEEKDTTRSDSPRRGREETRERVLSRPQSPRRHVSEKDHLESRRDDRSIRNGASDAYNSSRSRADDLQPPPAGPRSDRPLDRTNERSSSDRSAFQPTQNLPRSVDPEHGRLNATPRQQSDPNFGRLNPTPGPASTAALDIPSGPRDRNMRTGRPQRQDWRVDGPRPPTPEKQPPTGPSGRNPRRSASGQFDQSSASQGPVPSTPIAASPAPGIHPDRLKQLGSTVVPPPPPSTPATAAAPPIHPDRLKAFGNESPVMPPPTAQQSNNRSRPPLPPVATGVPPSGPKGSQPSPGGLGANGLAAPTGPASATERAARGGRRQLAGINTTLQQAGMQNAPDRSNMRGRGRMSSGMGPETPISGPPTPSVPPPPPGPPPPRADAARDAARAIINHERADLITGTSAPSEERDRDRNGRRERSGRSRRSSRSPGRERDPKRGPAEEDRSRSDYRERREPERDRHAPRSPARDLIAGRETGSGRDSGRERERERERDGSRRDGRERDATRDPHEAGWSGERGAERGAERGSERGGSGRSRETRGDMRGEERRDSRGAREDGGRKRHSEEGMDSRGREKRPRR
jgi:THO complex subunit 2